MPALPRYDFDLKSAGELAGAFALSYGIRCRVLSERGEVIDSYGRDAGECEFLRGLPGEAPWCDKLHARGIFQAARFGGRYIYSCPAGLTYFTSPIMIGGAVAGALMAGPVLLTDPDELTEDIIEKRGLPAGGIRSLRVFFSELPQVEPTRLRGMSIQLYASAVCISDEGRSLLLSKNEDRQQRSISQYVHQVKASGERARYPVQSERELLGAISHGNKQRAAALLNEILGHIFFFTPDPAEVSTRITELLVLISRGAVYGGADCEMVFQASFRYMQQLHRLSTQEEVAQWLARVLGQFTNLVFDLVDSRHRNIIRKAVNFIEANCGRSISLEEIAGHVGYSPSHFSKVFKDETGLNFRAYVNKVRIEKSKALLAAGQTSMSEICELCGFEDQSYFCKVFRRVVGVTPDRFRKQGCDRKINWEKEYGK